jgi:xanthine dehydrogenase small subunit
MTLPARPLRLLRGLRETRVDRVAPDAMLLDWLRACAGHGTREGCAEGDCGACTVVVGELDGERAVLRAVNSCIRPLSSVDGCAVFTVEDLAASDGALHPVQQAMIDHHASQCGFCTPGFVMSLFAMYHADGDPPAHVSRAQAQAAISGNLCRCTGYRPILDAACALPAMPARPFDHDALAGALRGLHDASGARFESPEGTVWRPATLEQALACRAERPQALVVAGATDVGLWINKQHRRPAETLDLGAVAGLAAIARDADGLLIGAGARLTEAFAALAADHPAVAGFLERFAGRPVRNAGTLGGNVANGSPIGDSMPLLLALDARLVLASTRGRREVPIDTFYTGYRQTVLQPDELLVAIRIPPAAAGLELRAWKVSKRFEDDISAVCVAIALRREAGIVAHARIGVGGMAAVPSRAPRAEAALAGAPWSLASLEAAADALRGEFTPLSDMRASAGYRRAVAGHLLLRLWHELEGRSPPLQALEASP